MGRIILAGLSVDGEPMTDRPLFRNGRVILKVRDLPDGSMLMFKPFVLKDEHIMNLTGAPGWDKEHVDAVFSEGVVGGLRYTFGIVQYDIAIDEFREHAFVRALSGLEEQYHLHRKYYKSTGLRTVSPKREDAEPIVTMPSKVTFGEWVPCTRCKTSGAEPDKRSERCSKCQGQGYLRWSLATS